MQFKLLVHPVPFQYPGRHEDLAAYDQFTANKTLGEIAFKEKKLFHTAFFVTKMIRKQWVLNLYEYILRVDSITDSKRMAL